MTFLRHITAAGAALLCIGLGQPVQAQGTRAVRDAMPGLKFDKQDQALMMASVKQALGSDKEGEPLHWKSERTPAMGSVTPLARYEEGGMACRRLKIHNAFGEVKAEGVYRFCEKTAGNWKLVGPDR